MAEVETPLSSNGFASSYDDEDDLFPRLRQEAEEVLRDEPQLCSLLHQTVLAKDVKSFDDAVFFAVCYRLMLGQNPCVVCPESIRDMFRRAFDSTELEGGHTLSEAVREDALANLRRDPACESILEVVLFFKGFAALVCHRVAHRKWFERDEKRSFAALYLQSQASAAFGVDIHPAATIGSGIMLDHATGVVIGETAVVGDGTTMLHGVTLGGTGKEAGDRHPKIGRDVFLGAGASILGNVSVGNAAKIGAGSIVLRPIPAGATAVGVPAKIIGRAAEPKPGSDADDNLKNVNLLHKSKSLLQLQKQESMESSTSTTPTVTFSVEGDDDCCCPYREYTRMAKEAPEGTITILTMCDILKHEAMNCELVKDAFFALDTKNVGYVRPADFLERGADVIKENTDIDPKRVDEIMGYYRNHGALSTTCCNATDSPVEMA